MKKKIRQLYQQLLREIAFCHLMQNMKMVDYWVLH